MTQNYEIKNRWTDEVLFSFEIAEVKESGMIARHALEAAITQGANLRGVNLRGVNLEGVNLWGANLKDANLRDANLRGANLRGANLRGANLVDANLEDANLRDANLRGANLRGANLRDANLEDANLEDANLEDANLLGANLRGANLRDAKNVPILISGLQWIVVINGLGEMWIGCQHHSVEEWKSFDDNEISKMSPDALVFWNNHKTMLLAVCETHVHTKQEEV